MKSKVKQIFIICFCAIIAHQNAAFAEYEVIKATTVGNKNIIETHTEIFENSFDDMDSGDYQENQNKDTLMSKIEQKILSRKKKKNKEESDFENFEEEIIEEDITEEDTKEETDVQKQNNIATENTSTNKTKQEDIKVDNKNTFQINADKITYNDNDGNIYADGNVEIIAKHQGITLKANHAILDKDSQTIKLQENVKIIKAGTEMKGEYLLVDLNEENVLMENPTLEAYSFKINAQEGYLIANDIQMLNGTVKYNKDTEFPFMTRGFMRLNNTPQTYLAERQKNGYSYTDGEKTQSYEINAKEIVLTSYRDHNSLVIKDADLFLNKKKLLNKADIELLSDKTNQVHEISFPEAGTLRSFGTYLGYGFVHKLPKGHILKLMPAIVYGESTLGVGLVGRHKSQNNTVEAGWATSTENLVVRGRYNIGNGFRATYGRNAYIPEGFLGARRAGYAAQLEWKKSYYIDDLKIRFNQGVFGGIFSDYKRHNQSDAYATTRFRYIAEIRKNIFSVENKEQDLKFGLNMTAQGAAALYGSGETVGIARFGPSIVTKVKGWESNLAYMFAGIHGLSPFMFDEYRYGKSTIQLNEKFNFNDKFAIGYRAYISPLKDNYKDDLLTESRFYAIFGPQDLKVAVSYDFVREVAHMDFMFLIGSKSSKINFDKFTTQDMDGGKEKRDFYKNKKSIKIDKPENI